MAKRKGNPKMRRCAKKCKGRRKRGYIACMRVCLRKR